MIHIRKRLIRQLLLNQLAIQLSSRMYHHQRPLLQFILLMRQQLHAWQVWALVLVSIVDKWFDHGGEYVELLCPKSTNNGDLFRRGVRVPSLPGTIHLKSSFICHPLSFPTR